MKYIFIKVVRKPPFSYFFKCLTEGKRKNTIFNDFLGNFLDFSRKPPFSYFFKCLTEGKRKNTIFNDFLGNFLDFSRFQSKLGQNLVKS